MAEIRWLPREQDSERLRPVLAFITRSAWYGVRFGRERYMSFGERYQGTRGIPIQWVRFCGGLISFCRRPIPDDRKYARFGMGGERG